MRASLCVLASLCGLVYSRPCLPAHLHLPASPYRPGCLSEHQPGPLSRRPLHAVPADGGERAAPSVRGRAHLPGDASSPPTPGRPRVRGRCGPGTPWRSRGGTSHISRLPSQHDDGDGLPPHSPVGFSFPSLLTSLFKMLGTGSSRCAARLSGISVPKKPIKPLILY